MTTFQSTAGVVGLYEDDGPASDGDDDAGMQAAIAGVLRETRAAALRSSQKPLSERVGEREAESDRMERALAAKVSELRDVEAGLESSRLELDALRLGTADSTDALAGDIDGAQTTVERLAQDVEALRDELDSKRALKAALEEVSERSAPVPRSRESPHSHTPRTTGPGQEDRPSRPPRQHAQRQASAVQAAARGGAGERRAAVGTRRGVGRAAGRGGARDGAVRQEQAGHRGVRGGAPGAEERGEPVRREK